jgi:hypothetical protein
MAETFETNLDAEQLKVISLSLVKGERILWTGRMRGMAFLSRGFSHYISSILQILASAAWISTSILISSEKGDWFSAIWSLFGLIPGVTGLILLASPYYWAWAGNRSYGAVTDRRTIIVYQHLDLEVFSYMHDDPIVPTLRAEQPNSSDIIFEDKSRRNNNESQSEGINLEAQFGFRYIGLMGIDNGAEVFEKIREQRRLLNHNPSTNVRLS